MALPKKPKDVEDFIKDAKADKEVDKDNLQEHPKAKKFLIEMPYDLWMKLKLRAVREDKSLKQIILEILESNAD